MREKKNYFDVWSTFSASLSRLFLLVIIFWRMFKISWLIRRHNVKLTFEFLELPWSRIAFDTVEFTTRMLDDVFKYTRRVSWRDNPSFTRMTWAPSLGCLFNIQQSGIKSVVDLSGDLFERLKPVKFQFEQHNFGLLDNARPIHHQLPLFPASTILYGPYTLVCLLVRLMYVRQRFEVVLALFSLFCSFFEPETVFKFWGPSTWPFSVLFFVACREKAEVKPIL